MLVISSHSDLARADDGKSFRSIACLHASLASPPTLKMAIKTIWQMTACVDIFIQFSPELFNTNVAV